MYIYIYTPITVPSQEHFFARFRARFRPDLTSHFDRLPTRLGADSGGSWGRLEPVRALPWDPSWAVLGPLWTLRGHLGAI